MRLFNVSIVLFFFLSLLSCQEKNKTSFVPVLKLAEVLKKEKTIEMSDFFSEIKTVQLETSDSILIKDISNIILSHEFIIVHHDKQCSVFDLEGHFIRKIGSKGQGPREYLAIINLFLEGDTIWIYDYTKILSFDINGQFLNSFESRKYVSHCTISGDLIIGYCLNNSGTEKNKFLFFDKQGSLVDSVPNSTKYSTDRGIRFSSLDVIMYHFIGSFYFKEIANDTLFSISINKTLIPLYVMDLGNYTLKEKDLFVKRTTNDVFSWMRTIKFIYVILETKSHLLLSVKFELDRYFLYDKEKGTVENVAFIYDEKERKRFVNDFFKPRFISENKQILISYENHADIDNTDNPVVVIAKLK